ncbi:MAG: hypothetical protein GX242_01005 [Clostridiales bacterium]|nr:hypothetical protein [Clostridiales bacterium]
MRKKKKKDIEEFELQYPGPIAEEEEIFERNYFEEYYLAYKNDYITQYLDVYRKLKEQEKNNNK